MDLPIFPLRRKFNEHNNTIEGLEHGLTAEGKKMGDPVQFLGQERCPDGEDGDNGKVESMVVDYGGPLYKYDKRGRKLLTDAQNVWIRQATDPRGFRPASYSPAEWAKLNAEQKEEILKSHIGERTVLLPHEGPIFGQGTNLAKDFLVASGQIDDMSIGDFFEACMAGGEAWLTMHRRKFN